MVLRRAGGGAPRWPPLIGSDIVHCIPPSLDEKLYPAHKLAALVGVLVEDGVPVADALGGTGIAETRLQSASTRVSYRQLLAVFRNALRLSSDPALALRAGQRMRVTSYGLYGYALLSSPSHAASIDLGLKYHRVMGPVADVRFLEADGKAVFEYDPLLSTDPGDELYRALMEFHMASHVTLSRDLYGDQFRLSGLRAAYPAPAHARRYDAIFKCPVHFGEAQNQLIFDACWIERPMDFSDPITNAMAREVCDRGLLEVGSSGGVAAATQRILLEHPGKFPGIDKVAAALSMNTRTLRRRLDAEQTSYRKVLAEVRMRLAIEYLRKTPMTNEEIAARLGYSDAANFRHALMRWTFKKPSDFRAG